MPLCTECQYNWSWKESMSLSFNWSGSQEISCPACRVGQYVSAGPSVNYQWFSPSLFFSFCYLFFFLFFLTFFYYFVLLSFCYSIFFFALFIFYYSLFCTHTCQYIGLLLAY